MGSLYIDDVVREALSHEGEVCGKTNDFSAELDSISYFNTPKNGVANSCSIYICDMTYRSTRNSNGEIDPDKWDSYYFLFQPSGPSNCGAGCTQQAGYFASNGSLFYSTSDAAVGDWCFFTNDGGSTYYHVGLVYDWDDNGIYTVEGNTDGGYVGTHFYPYSDSRIGAFGRPRYDGRTYGESEKEPDKPKEDSKPKEFVNISMPVLKKGVDDYGTVLTIQALLRGFGFTDDFGNTISIDGIFGEATEQAVKSYQAARNLNVCGIVNEETWNRILK